MEANQWSNNCVPVYQQLNEWKFQPSNHIYIFYIQKFKFREKIQKPKIILVAFKAWSLPSENLCK